MNTEQPIETAPKDTLRLVAHNWSDTSLFSDATGAQICTHSIYGEATEDTQDELESQQARNMERLRDCWNLLAGHDLSSVVAVDREVMEKEMTLEVVSGPEGPCLIINGKRIAGPKPWGGGTVLHSFKVSMKHLASLNAAVNV